MYDPDVSTGQTMIEVVEPRNVTMYPRHWATVEAFGKDQGYGSVSAALRRIVDEWMQLKAGQMGLPFPIQNQ